MAIDKNAMAWNIKKFSSTGRAAQAGWLLFLIVVMSLALPGIAIYREALQTACVGDGCLMGQFTPIEAEAAQAQGDTLADFGSILFIVYLFTDALLLLTSAVLIWRKPNHMGAVCGAFLFAAAATATLAQASANHSGAENWLGNFAVQSIQFVQLAFLFPTFSLVPDGRFRPAWLQWIALAFIPAAALIAFDLSLPTVRMALGIVIGVSILASVLYRWLADKPRQEPVTWILVTVALLAGAQWMGRPIQWLPLPYVILDNLSGMGFSPYPVFGMHPLVE